MNIEHFGQLRHVTIDVVKEFNICSDIQITYKGEPLTKVRSLTFLLAPMENDLGNQLLLDDLEVPYDGKKTTN